MIVVRRQAEIFPPRLGADAAAGQAFAQHLVIKRVIAQQPAADPPALAKPNIAHQIVLAPGYRILVPRQVAIVILQWHEPAPFTAGELPLFIDQQVDIGVAPRREPALQLVTHFIAEFVDGEHLRLLARRQSVIAHAGLAEFLRHFGKVSGVVIDLRGDPQIGQGIFSLGRKSGVAGGQRPEGAPGSSRRKIRDGSKRYDTGINRFCAGSQKNWKIVLVYRFSLLPQPCRQFQEYAETGWANSRPTTEGAAAPLRPGAGRLRRQQRVELRHAGAAVGPALKPGAQSPNTGAAAGDGLADRPLPHPKTAADDSAPARGGGVRSAAEQRMAPGGIGRRRGEGGAIPALSTAGSRASLHQPSISLP